MIATMPADRWFRRFGKPVDAQRRLVCFHHAGGGASLFRDWHGSFPADTEVLAVAIPGRETRIAEAPLTELRMLAAALAEVLPLELPFAFFGHSLGGVVSFELARQLHQRGLPIPQHLFVSACPAPHLCRRETSRAQMSDEALLRLLEGFGGTPREIVAKLNAAAAKILAQADFRAQLARDGLDPIGGTAEWFDAYFRGEVEKLGAVIRAAGTKPE